MRFSFYAIAIALFLLSGIAKAQLVSDKGRFSVDYNQGCVPYDITITNNYQPGVKKSWFLLYEGDAIHTEITPAVQSETVTFSVEKDKKLTIIQWTQGDQDLEDRLIVRGHTASEPSFNLYACSNRGGIAQIQDPVYDYYEVMFGENTTPVRADASTNFSADGQFPTAGDNLVVVRGFYNNAPDNCGEAGTYLMALSQLPVPEWNGLQWDHTSNTINLEYSLDPQLRYQLEMLNPTSGNFERFNGLSSTSTDTTFIVQNLENQYYCFRIKAIDDCFGNSMNSVPICTATWSLTAEEGFNKVEYVTHPSFYGTIVLQRPNGDQVASSDGASATFQDEDVLCKQEYCYQLQLLPDAPGSASSLSNTSCVEAISNRPLPQVTDIASIWDANDQLLIIPQFPIIANTLNLKLLDEQGRTVTEATGDSLQFTAKPSGECYNFTYGSLCATQTAEPTKVCPLYLRNGAAELDEFIPSWNEYVGYAQGVSGYFLEELAEDGEFLEGWDLGVELSYTGFGTFSEADVGRRFRVIAYPSDALLPPSYSNIFTFTLIMKGYFPNAFSPNGDGVNDEFKILGKFVSNASIWVYSRWGEKLFHSNNKDKGWDGIFGGKPLPEGTYMYKAEVTTRDGKQESFSGTIFLKR